MSAQSTFAFGHEPSSGADAFMPAAGNQAALGWLRRWPDWPAPALVLHGPPGCGKTHLARIFAARAGAVWLDPATLIPAALPPAASHAAAFLEAPPAAVVLDPAIPVADERALLGLYNRIQERRGHLLLCARRPVVAWGLTLPDLASRLKAAPAVAIEPPDDALLGTLLIKLFGDRQLTVPGEVIPYALSRMERSFAAAHRLVDGLDALSLEEQRPITVALARRLLERAESSIRV